MIEMTTADLAADGLAMSAGYAHLRAPTSHLPQNMGSLSRRVEALVRDTTMSYADIVATVREEFPQASTSTKSVASVASVMRKKGIHVPLRLKLNMV